MKAEISLGDALDRLTILGIKLDELLNGSERWELVRRDRDGLMSSVMEAYPKAMTEHKDEISLLSSINREIWDSQSEQHGLDKAGDHGQMYVSACRSIHRLNERRVKVKSIIDEKVKSPIREVKVYA